MTMSDRWMPERDTASFRNGTVTVVTGATVTVDIGGTVLAGVPCYGPPPAVGSRVLLLEQGNGVTVIGSTATVTAEVAVLRKDIAVLRGLCEELLMRTDKKGGK